MHPEDGDHRLEAPLLRHELLRRRRHEADPPAELVGSVGVAPGANDVAGLSGRKQHEAPVHERPDRREPELELRDDAEVAAAPSQAPEQLRVLVLRRRQELAGRGDDVSAHEVVAREAERTRKQAEMQRV